MAKKSQAVKQCVNGFIVDFPVKPYPTQVAMMDKILKAIDRNENALLESPTGSGKSLALLCSTLSWQRKAIEKAFEARQEMIQACECNCMCHVTGKPVKAPPLPYKKTSPPSPATVALQSAQAMAAASLRGVKPYPFSAVASPALRSPQPVPMAAASPLRATGAPTPIGPLTASVPTAGVATNVPSALARLPDSSSCATGSGKRPSAGVDSEDSDPDFKPMNKKLRGSIHSYPKPRQHVGIKYEDDDEEYGASVGTDGAAGASKMASWSCHVKSGSPAGPIASMPGVAGGDVDASYQPATPKLQPSSASSSGSVEICYACKCPICDQQAKMHRDKQMKQRVPTIYYGTRTHKQIAQIAHELRKTAFSQVEMAILASREHYCVHPVVSKSANKTENCREHVKNGDCTFHRNVHKISAHDKVAMLGLDQAWDIEDLITVATRKKTKACPYFGARELAKNSRIVFCPYNYLIDPRIRKLMDIELAGNIVVLDEAHNIEDSARDAASCSVTAEDIELALINLRKLITKSILTHHHTPLESMLVSIATWVQSTEDSLISCEFEKFSRTWLGVEMVRELDRKCSLNAQTLAIYKTHYGEASRYLQEQRQLAVQGDPRDFNDLDDELLTSTTVVLFDALFMVLTYLLANNAQHAVDYRIGVLKTRAKPKPVVATNGFQRRPQRNDSEYWTLTIHFWCLNPAVCFKEIDTEARTIILTSGTLAPIGSFSSELGVPFTISMEGNHVVPKQQVWVQTLSCGPNNVTLNATFKHVETLAFQDELGLVMEQVCETVPYGVLCFLPSYSMMDKLIRRWSMTGLLDRIQHTKHVILEPRHGGDEFEAKLREYYDAVQSADLERRRSMQTGAILFAVCRGKVSEGLDFTDNNARAVITIGIPFPNIKDKLVELKRAYNNQQISRGLLNGSEWYEIQAFRAINQALGRCIRHKADWGALILIDERFRTRSGRYVNGLSKWVRGSVHHAESCASAMQSLKQFMQLRLQCAAVEAAEAEFSDTQSVPSMPATPADKFGWEASASSPVPACCSSSTPSGALADPTASAKHFPAFSHSNTRPGAAFNPPTVVKKEREASAIPAAIPSTMLTPYDFQLDTCIRLKQGASRSVQESAPQTRPSVDATETCCTPAMFDHAYVLGPLLSLRSVKPASTMSSTPTTSQVYGGLPAAGQRVASAVPSLCGDRGVAPLGALDSTLNYSPGARDDALPATQPYCSQAAAALLRTAEGCQDSVRRTATKRGLGPRTHAAVGKPSTFPAIYPCLASQELLHSRPRSTTAAPTFTAATFSPQASPASRASVAMTSGIYPSLAEMRTSVQSSPVRGENQAISSSLTARGASIACSSAAMSRGSLSTVPASVEDTAAGEHGTFGGTIPAGMPVRSASRTDAIEVSDSDSDRDVIESSQRAAPQLAIVIPESPPAASVGSDACSESDVADSDAGDSGDTSPASQSADAATDLGVQRCDEQSQQEEDDLLVQLTQEAEASHLSLCDAVSSSTAAPVKVDEHVYSGLCTKRRNTRLCARRDSAQGSSGDAAATGALNCAVDALSIAASPCDGAAGPVSSCVSEESRHEVADESGVETVAVMCRKCGAHLAYTTNNDAPRNDDKSLLVRKLLHGWLQTVSPASLVAQLKTNTRRSSARNKKKTTTVETTTTCGVSELCDVIQAKSLPPGSDGGDAALKYWTGSEHCSDKRLESLQCAGEDGVNVTLDPVVCGHCATSPANDASTSAAARTRRKVYFDKPTSVSDTESALVLGVRCAPLCQSDVAQSMSELWLLSSCCRTEYL